MTAMNTSTATTSDRELVIERIFDAPREMVFSAWTSCEHLAHWFGPKDFTAPSCEVDFRVGGSYRIVMRSPEGDEHPVWGEYREIIEPERIVFSWNRGHDLRGELWSATLVEVTFEDAGDKTHFTWRQGSFETTSYCDEHSFGWNQSLDRRGEFVEQL